jgi:hypothetical protein
MQFTFRLETAIQLSERFDGAARGPRALLKKR